MSEPKGSTPTDCLSEIDIVVLAGGLGTRLQGVLDDRPKVMAPLDDRPYLDFLISWLRRYGARRIILGLGHLAEVVQAFLVETEYPGIEIVMAIEPAPLGTAGAIRFLRRYFQTSPVLVINGDSFIDVDLCRFVEAHKTTGAAATILCAAVADGGAFGRVRIDAGNRIQGFEEKAAGRNGTATINAGIYLFERDMLNRIDEYEGPSLERDVFEKLPAGFLHAMRCAGDFIDIGTPEKLASAAAFFSRFRNTA